MIEVQNIKPATNSLLPSLEELPLNASPKQVEAYTGVPSATLAFWRYEGTHLPFIKLGRLIRYRRQDVLDFVENNVYSSTTEAKAAR
jgi:hypothetical protein